MIQHPQQLRSPRGRARYASWLVLSLRSKLEQLAIGN